MKAWWRRVRPRVVSLPLYVLSRAIGITLRIHTVGWEQYKDVTNAVISGWHGRSFIALNLFYKKGLYIMTSLSRDGEIQTRIFEKYGFIAIRGSSSRGGAQALAESIRALKKGGVMAMTPDGPRGPSGVVQPGLILMSKKSGAQLIPIGLAAQRRWTMGTWDRYMLPKPFSKCVVVFGESLVVPKDADEAEMDRCRRELELRMHKAQREADELTGHPTYEPVLEDASDSSSNSDSSSRSTLTQ